MPTSEDRPWETPPVQLWDALHGRELRKEDVLYALMAMIALIDNLSSLNWHCIGDMAFFYRAATLSALARPTVTTGAGDIRRDRPRPTTSIERRRAPAARLPRSTSGWARSRFCAILF